MKIRMRLLAGAALALLSSLTVSAQPQTYRPVTDAMLQNPDAGERLQWRRTQDAQGYSPLNQITKDNVGQLQLAW
jgi:alcohol dehydrogenase (cytochrome c)